MPMQRIDGPCEWPVADDEVRAALEAAYRDGSWGRYHGPHGAALVADLSAAFACQHAFLCSSGTIGVELALRGCGVEAGDEVILAGYDFPGNFRAVEAIGARPVLVDVDPSSWCLDAERLAAVERERVRAVIVSHLHGGVAEMPKINQLARQRKWAVVEDACQQPGAQLDGRPLGSWGDAGVLSFGGSKLLTAGRGGAVLTDDPHILQRMKVYAERGNWAFPLSELQAAVLRPQLVKLDARNQKRRESVAIILDALAGVTEWLRPLGSRENAAPAYYKLAWSLIAAENAGHVRDQLIAGLQAAGVPIDIGFRGFVRRSGRRCEKVGSLEISKQLSQSTLLLHHPILLGNKKTALQVGQGLDHEVRKLVS
ncbi:MAG: DegT/DnrJ/EryC1/StrS family aminotransferase [Bythopirellula sp.]